MAAELVPSGYWKLSPHARWAEYKKLVSRLQGRGSPLLAGAPNLLAASREEIWRLCEPSLDGSRAKGLGQYFTPEDVCQAAWSAIPASARTALDPTMGHGVFLKVAARRVPALRLTGVELDPTLVRAAKLVLPAKSDLHCADFLSWIANQPTRRWDAVVGNPPYVSYQALAATDSLLSPDTAYRRRALGALTRLAKTANAPRAYHRMLAEFSGYSDLSMYVLAASWIALREGGTLAFVMTNHWLEREYGLPVLQFLQETGSIRRLVVDAERDWFPGALVPTNIMVYRKDLNLGGEADVPVVRLSRPGLRNHAFLNSVVPGATYDGLHNLQRVRRASVARSKGRLLELGWVARQGLRTGCNGFFYLRMEGTLLRSTVSTQAGVTISWDTARPFVRPTIQNIGRRSSLSLDESDADCFVLALGPKTAKPRPLPSELATYVNRAKRMVYGKSGKRIPLLSAVAPNASAGRGRRQRHWFELSLTPRHFGRIILPRVSYGILRAYHVSQQKPVVTDANFVTILSEANPGATPLHLWVALNSNSFRLAAEREGTPLGGGALKLEANQVNQIEIGGLHGTQDQIREIAGRLSAQDISDEKLLDIGEEVDRLVIRQPDPRATRKRLEDLVGNRRRPRTSSQPQLKP